MSVHVDSEMGRGAIHPDKGDITLSCIRIFDTG